MSGTLSYRVLGPLAVLRDGEPIRLGGPKERLILATLLLSSNRVVAAHRLIDVLWDEDPPKSAVGALQVHVSNLRRRLQGGSPAVVTQPPGYVVAATAAELDLLRFEELVAQAQEKHTSNDLSGALDKYLAALGLWRGDGLADLESTDFIEGSRTFLEERRIAVEEDVVSLLLAMGRNQEALLRAASVLDAHPLRESMWEHRMMALYRTGRQAEALDAFRKCRDMLLDQLGVDPNPRLRSVESAILRQDPGLDLRPAEQVRPASLTARPGALGSSEAPASHTQSNAVTYVRQRKQAFLVRNDGSLVALDDVVTLGRNPDCQVVLTDAAVSRRHAEIRPALGGHLLVDLMSSNGTEVAGNVVMQHMLEHGDTVQIGSESLTYVRR